MKKTLLYFSLLFFTFSFFSTNVKAFSIVSANDNETIQNLYKECVNAVPVLTKTAANSDIYVTDADVYLMAQIVHAESKGEPYTGKIAVASVILNRVKDPHFPNTIKEVILQKNAFSCVNKGVIKEVPDEESYRAVLDALKGTDPTDKAVFFYNPKIATSKWMKNVNKKNIKTIGNHVFFLAS